MTRCALAMLEAAVDTLGYATPQDFADICSELRRVQAECERLERENTRLRSTQGCVEVLREDQGMIDPEEDLRW